MSSTAGNVIPDDVRDAIADILSDEEENASLPSLDRIQETIPDEEKAKRHSRSKVKSLRRRVPVVEKDGGHTTLQTLRDGVSER